MAGLTLTTDVQEENNVNVRANIVYFLEDLCELARREKHEAYIRMVERDFPKIIDASIPLDGMGIVNVNCVRGVSVFQLECMCRPLRFRFCITSTMNMAFSFRQIAM